MDDNDAQHPDGVHDSVLFVVQTIMR